MAKITFSKRAIRKNYRMNQVSRALIARSRRDWLAVSDDAESDTKHNDTLIKRLKNSPPFILAGLIGVAIGSGLDIADKAEKVFGKSDTIVLAENTDKSHFSDDLVRKAYKRLFLADLFVRRVEDEAPTKFIEETWKEYVESVKEWNVDLMINIAGLANFYDDKHSLYFENFIQPAMIASDTAVRDVAKSPYVRAVLRDDPTTSPRGLDKGKTDAVGEATSTARHRLYGFIFCMQPKESDRLPMCKNQGF